MVEGYTDVIALDQAGVPATSWPRAGPRWARSTSASWRGSPSRLVLAFDSDEAGARAAERAFQFHQEYPVDVSVLVLPAGPGPGGLRVWLRADDAVRGARRRAAVPLVEYMLDRSLAGPDLSTASRSGPARCASGWRSWPGSRIPVRRQEYARMLAGKVGEPEVSVMLELERR